MGNTSSCACDDSRYQTPSDTVPEASVDNRPTLALHAYSQTVHGCSPPPTPDVRHPPECDLPIPRYAALPPGEKGPRPSDRRRPAKPPVPNACTGVAFPLCPSLDIGGIPPDPENPVAPTLTQDSPSGPSVDGSTVLLGTNGSSVLAPVHDGPPGCSMNGNRSSYGADVSGPVPQSNVLDAACLHVFPVDMVKDSKYRQEDNGPLNPHGSVSQHPIGGATSFSLVLDDSRALSSPLLMLTTPGQCCQSLMSPLSPICWRLLMSPHRPPLLMCLDPHRPPLLMCSDPHRPLLQTCQDPHRPALTACNPSLLWWVPLRPHVMILMSHNDVLPTTVLDVAVVLLYSSMTPLGRRSFSMAARITAHQMTPVTPHPWPVWCRTFATVFTSLQPCGCISYFRHRVASPHLPISSSPPPPPTSQYRHIM